MMQHKIISDVDKQIAVIGISSDMIDFSNYFGYFGGMLFFTRTIPLYLGQKKSIILSKSLANVDKQIIGKISEITEEQLKKEDLLNTNTIEHLKNLLNKNGFYIKDWLIQGEHKMFLFNESDREFKYRKSLRSDDLLILKVIPSQNT